LELGRGYCLARFEAVTPKERRAIWIIFAIAWIALGAWRLIMWKTPDNIWLGVGSILLGIGWVLIAVFKKSV
jgi:hypothetical protein